MKTHSERNLIQLLLGLGLIVMVAIPGQSRIQTLKLVPADVANSDRFGRSVALRGSVALIGANNDDDNGENAGSARLFDVSTGQLLRQLLPEDGAAGDEFGYAVALTADLALVGAERADARGESSGVAYLFDATTGQQQVCSHRQRGRGQIRNIRSHQRRMGQVQWCRRHLGV